MAGVSAHPGKFGFVAYHNLLRFGFDGPVFALNRDGAEVLGQKTIRDVAELPEGAADLVFVCTPQAANAELLRACAKRGVRAAFVASGGYGEAGEEGRRHERELVALADELGMVVAGPNGQGVISTPRSMCAQIVAPYPPPGRISVASQSGNLVSSFLNYAVLTGHRRLEGDLGGELGAARPRRLPRVLRGRSRDGGGARLPRGRAATGGASPRRARALAAQKPLVLLKGGVAAEGKRAAASHTGSLASDDRHLRRRLPRRWARCARRRSSRPSSGPRRSPRSRCRAAGARSCSPRRAAGACSPPTPAPRRASSWCRCPTICAQRSTRWCRRAGAAATRSTSRAARRATRSPRCSTCICAHPDVDAVIHLGLGIQATQAQAFRSGSFFPGHGLDRIVEFHERQDRRYAKAAREASERHGKPVLVATELTYTDRVYGNAGPVGVREEGRLCYPSAHRAVAALRALVDYAEFRKEAR